MVVAAVLVAAELRIIFSIVCFRVRSSSNTCLMSKLARELKPDKELVCFKAKSSLIPPSSAKRVACENVRVRRKQSLSMAFKASGSTGTAISPTAALNSAWDCVGVNPEHL